MCGIVGIWNRNGSPVDPSLLAKMRDTMIHRGPDGAGLWISPDGATGLGHRRLSIIDLSAAASQPMANEDGTIQTVFNGEIYNHADIRAELEKIGGHVWRTNHSDTETIIHAFEQWGIGFVHRLRGIFAIGLFDVRRRELWLIRDRLGIKPLYFTASNNRIAFASEIKALLADPAQSRRLDEDAFFHYLSFLAAPAPQTLFAGIDKLSAATWLRFRADGSSEEHRYWDPLDNLTPRTNASEEDLCHELLATLRTSVGLRKISDVPVGVFLSGGIDSSTNAALFSEGETRPVRTFSIGYEGDNASYRNELTFARQMAQRTGAEHHEYLISQNDLLGFLPRMIELQDEPIADPVCVPVHFVSKLARENGVIVAQVGEGADELFCGYPGWLESLRLQRLDHLPAPRALKSAVQSAMRAFDGPNNMAVEWLRRSRAGRPIFWGSADTMTHEAKLLMLSPRLRKKFAARDSWEAIAPIHERYRTKAWEQHPLQWMSYVDLNFRLPELLHMRLDKMSMGVGLEAREPFLDHKLVELAMSIPAAAKLGGGKTTKHLLKKTVRGLIPDSIINRPKQGFGVPVNEWLRDRLGAQIRNDLETFCRETDLFDAQEINRILENPRRGIAWTLMNFAMWWKAFKLT